MDILEKAVVLFLLLFFMFIAYIAGHNDGKDETLIETQAQSCIYDMAERAAEFTARQIELGDLNTAVLAKVTSYSNNLIWPEIDIDAVTKACVAGLMPKTPVTP